MKYPMIPIIAAIGFAMAVPANDAICQSHAQHEVQNSASPNGQDDADKAEGPRDVSNKIYWVSDRDGIFGRGGRIVSSDLSTGHHVIYATLQPKVHGYPITDSKHTGVDIREIYIKGPLGTLTAIPNYCLHQVTRGIDSCEVSLRWEAESEQPVIYDSAGNLINLAPSSSESQVMVSVPPEGEIYRLYNGLDQEVKLDTATVTAFKPAGDMLVQVETGSGGTGTCRADPETKRCDLLVHWNTWHANMASLWVKHSAADEWLRLSDDPSGTVFLEDFIGSGKVTFELHELQNRQSALLTNKQGKPVRIGLTVNLEIPGRKQP